MPAVSEEAFRCKYCSQFFVSKKAFLDHKRAQHWDEMSNRSDVLSVMSDISATMAPPAVPQTRARVSRVPRGERSPPRATTSRAPPSPRRALRSEETAAEPPESPPKKRGRPAKKINPKNMPARIGKKKKGPDGEEVEGEWIRNPKLKSG